jgi:hypothetical protein
MATESARCHSMALPYVIAWKKTYHILGIYAYIPCIYWALSSIHCIQASIMVYTRFIQVYKSLKIYILMTCKYMLVYIIVVSIFQFRISWSASWCCPDVVQPPCADAAAADGRRGSNIHQVNLWLWSFARGKPRLGGLSVEKTFESERSKQGACG